MRNDVEPEPGMAETEDEGSERRSLKDQVKRFVVERIDSGEWAASQPIMTEVQMAEALGVSRMTVHVALRELAAEGRLIRKRGSGTVVAPTRSFNTMFEIKNIATEIAERGGRHGADVIALRRIGATIDMAEALQIDVGEAVFQVRIVHRDGDTPVQFEDRTVNAEMTPDFGRQDFTLTTPSAFLVSKSIPSRVEQCIQAVLADAETAALLCVEIGAPLLKITRRTWRGDRISTRADLYHVGESYQLGGLATFAGASRVVA
jgi:GntR family histidine utilization transcriptional repressor